MALRKAADDQERMAKLLRQYRIRARDLNRAAYHSIGISPLHAAARAGNSDCVRLLLAHGANRRAEGSSTAECEAKNDFLQLHCVIWTYYTPCEMLQRTIMQLCTDTTM